MKFTLSSLKKYLETNASLDEICKKLTAIGLEVESVSDKSKILCEFTVAKILDCKDHENSSKLKICTVLVDRNNTQFQIVCGAKNARAGIKVAYAKINSAIPKNQMVIKKAKIAGIESFGMLCSASELMLNNDDEGIIEIDEKWSIGEKISDVFACNDAMIEVYATPNRGDCLGVFGIARDLSATGIGTLKQFSLTPLKNHFNFDLNVEIKDHLACEFVVYRQIKNIKNCQSPQWLKDELTAVGINAISAIVDIGNYVIHLTSQPMHCYDNSKINGNICIKLNHQSSKFTSLKNEELTIDENILTVNDQQKIIAIAGIIGAKSSACEDSSIDILLEAGNFNPSNIAYAGRKLNILSESRHRFERGSDPLNCELAINLATQMIVDICGSDSSMISDNKIIGNIRPNKIVEFDINLVKKLIGIDIKKNIAIEILIKLGFKVEEVNSLLRLTVPSYRNDITISEDIVEELIRIYGFEHINNQTLPSNFGLQSTELNKNKLDITKNNQNSEDKITFNNSFNFNYYTNLARQKLIARGFNETINWSFVEDKIIDLFYEKNPDLFLKNPVSIEMNYMRPTLAIGLLNSYKKNSLRNFHNLSFFEIGNIFKNNRHQQLAISGLRIGKNKENNHFHDDRDFDVFDIKQDLFSTLESLNIKPSSLDQSTDNSLRYFHPHRHLSLKFGKNIIANFGELHPAINQKFSIKNRINFFEIFIDEQLISKKSVNFKSFIANDFPIVERDFAVVVNLNLPAINMQKEIYNIDKNLIKEVNIFDIFTSENIGGDKKSVALNIKIQDHKTLSGEEIEAICNKIISTLHLKFNATLRV